MIFTLCLKVTLPQYNPTDGVNEKLLPTFTVQQVRVVATLITCTQEVLGSNLGWDTCYGVSHGFPQFLHGCMLE